MGWIASGDEEARLDKDRFKVKFWGTRGSIPVSGPQFARYGGNTSCVEMQCGGHRLMFDAGSGLHAAGEFLRHRQLGHIDLFFTHSHYDHVIGFPFFRPIYDNDTTLAIWSGHLAGAMTTKQMIKGVMHPPWFPAPLEICRAKFAWHDFATGDVLRPCAGVTIRTAPLNHPGNATGYRVEYGGRAVAYVTDTEHVGTALDPNVLKLIENVDLAIYDCTYLEAEMEGRRGFGHSSWEQGVKLCKAAGAKKLALFHHDPVRTDEELAAMERDAAAALPGSFAAKDGQVLEFATAQVEA